MRAPKLAKILLFAVLLALIVVPTANYAAELMAGRTVQPALHPQAPAATTTNALGITCGFGYIDNVTGAVATGRDGNGTILQQCNWAGDTDGDSPGTVAGSDPLVSDPAPLLTGVTCTTAPCGSPPGGGGVEVGIIINNLNDAINGFDLTISYDPTVLNAVVIDQQGLTFGASSGVLTLARTIDQTGG